MLVFPALPYELQWLINVVYWTLTILMVAVLVGDAERGRHDD